MDQPIDIKLTPRQARYLENVLRGYRWKVKEPMHSEIKELLRDVKKRQREREDKPMNGLEHLVETEQIICELYQGDLTTIEINDELVSNIVGVGYCPHEGGLRDAEFCNEHGPCDDCWRQVLEAEVEE